MRKTKSEQLESIPVAILCGGMGTRLREETDIRPKPMVAILLLSGFQLISIGVVAEYVGRIYREVQGRPLYVVDHTYGLESAKRHVQEYEV